jgi:hypothetical protein
MYYWLNLEREIKIPQMYEELEAAKNNQADLIRQEVSLREDYDRVKSFLYD